MKKLFLALAIYSVSSHSLFAQSEKWTADIPEAFKEPEPWRKFAQELVDRDFVFGAMAASHRMILFFNDLPTKEAAYKSIIELVDRGYPYSTLGLFISGDIEPRDNYEFSNSYNLYKAVLNRDKGMEKWAENYFAQVDKENFTKFLFFQALDDYGKGKLDTAEATLKKILKKDIPIEQQAFVKKVVRTLARIYFDREDYSGSFGIYQDFLLKINPVFPSDYLEAAWNLYYLKKYPQSLGLLFNFESSLNDPSLDLEQLSLRALIYKSLCRTKNFEQLGETFRSRYGKIVEGIKRGESLNDYPELQTFKVAGNAEFQQVRTTLQELKREREAYKNSTTGKGKLANYLYDSEIELLNGRLRGLKDRALERAANQLLLMAEQLKFMKFEVARQRFNPDTVFIPPTKSRISEIAENKFQIRWAQLGDFWRDERLSYKALISNDCKD